METKAALKKTLGHWRGNLCNMEPETAGSGHRHFRQQICPQLRRKRMIRVKQDARSMLAIAAALNSTMVTTMSNEEFGHVRPSEGTHGTHTGYKGLIEMQMEDYWHSESKEADQFDCEATLAFVAQLTEEEVLTLLVAMGKAPDHNDGDQWKAFANALCMEQYDEVEQMFQHRDRAARLRRVVGRGHRRQDQSLSGRRTVGLARRWAGPGRSQSDSSRRLGSQGSPRWSPGTVSLLLDRLLGRCRVEPHPTGHLCSYRCSARYAGMTIPAPFTYRPSGTCGLRSSIPMDFRVIAWTVDAGWAKEVSWGLLNGAECPRPALLHQILWWAGAGRGQRRLTWCRRGVKA